MESEKTALPARSRAEEASLPARRFRDRLFGGLFFLLTVLPLFLGLAIFIALLLRSLPVWRITSFWGALTSQVWQPLRGEFGFFPFIAGTVWVTLVAMILAVPPCLLTAIYLSEYAGSATRAIMKPLLDLLAAIPSVVYGVWGVVAIVPWVQHFLAPLMNKYLGFLPVFAVDNPTGYSIIAGGLVLAVMVAPFIIAVTFEVMRAVPEGLREASLAVGATRWQTVKFAVVPQTVPGIVAGVVLGGSRALGETMAVLMVVGNVVKVPHSIFDAAYPLPALIANNYGEMMSIPLYDAALLGAALILLVIILVFNLLSMLVLRRFTRRNW